MFPNGTKAQQADDYEEPCPGFMAVYKHDSGKRQTTRLWKDIPRLEPGQPIFDGLDSTFAGPLHPAFPKDCFYLSGRNQDWSNIMDDYIRLVFSRPTR